MNCLSKHATKGNIEGRVNVLVRGKIRTKREGAEI
jgi:hypothetical protein